MSDEAGKYFSFFKIGLKDSFAYKWDVLTSAVFRIAAPLVMLVVWSTIYIASNASTIGGFTLTQTYTYFFATSLMLLLVDTDAESAIQQDVLSGSVSAYMVKPVRYLFKVVSSDLSNTLLQTFMAGIPFSIILVFLLKLSITPFLVLMLVAELLVAVLFLYALAVFLGMLSFYVTNAYGIFNISWTLVYFLAGLSVPINFFPSSIGAIVQLLPFQILVYTPATTILQSISMGQAFANTLVAAVWLLAIVALDVLVWKRSVKRLAAAGG